MDEKNPNRDEPEHDERRSTKRRNPEVEPTHIWISVQKSLRGRVIDESKGGLGVQLDDKADADLFTIGFEVRVQHLGKRRTASIAYLDLEAAEGFRLGLQWND